MSLDPANELVTVLDDAGRPCGVATRADVRRDKLFHAATAILVRRSDGQIYVHRRTPTKDIYPGIFDCWAGGVLNAGETAEVGAAREVAEELGIHDATLLPILTTEWSDDLVRAIYHVYALTWDGPIVHQVEEVAWGDWWTPQMLADHLADPDFPFVPDGRRLIELAGVLPAAV